jgi:hypothetical protein
MSNGDTQNNCVMEVCCGGPGDEEKQVRALTKILVAHVDGVSKRDVKDIAAYLVSAYDFAPKGSLYAFKQEIARLAKTETYHDEG